MRELGALLSFSFSFSFFLFASMVAQETLDRIVLQYLEKRK